MTVTEAHVDEVQQTDSPQISHLIAKKDWHKAYILGSAIQALCGKVWVPSRDPEKYPLCEMCADLYEKMFGKRP